MLKKIVVIGPESTGKSTLCKQLADHYDTLWCPEFAREYLLQHGMKYTYDDLLTIAKGQIELEQKTESLVRISESGVQRTKDKSYSQLLFIDTNMYVMKVWCEFVFGKCHEYILEQIARREYHLYLLCNIDLPWVHDQLREYPDIERRQILYQMYKSLMANQTVPCVEISGNTEQRFSAAVAAVHTLVNQ